MTENIERTPRRRRTGTPETGFDKIEIDFLLLADWADTIGGKLYIQGAGWDRRVLENEGASAPFAIAAGILVPWNLTNTQHSFNLTFETGDGTKFGPSINGGFNLGRPAQATLGQTFRAPLSVRISLPMPGLGSYSVRLVVNNEVERRVAFYVVNAL